MRKYILAAAVMLGINFALPKMTVMAEETEVNQIQVPQKLQVVIDPWEMDGKGQIYSEQYIIKNTGKTAGTLTLSNLACVTGENSGVTVKDNMQGIHDGENKFVYMEFKVGDKEKIVLSQKGSEYKAEMKPGEELELAFSGEVNENASNSWKSGDIGITVTYSWEAKEMPEESVSQTEEEQQEEAEDNAGSEEEKNEEIIDLSETGETELFLDSWKADETGDIYSIQYTLRNTGENTGKLVLTGVVCKPKKENGIIVWTEKETLHDSEDKRVYMEFALTEEEKYIIPQEQENEEGFKYEVELKPGEELVFRLVGELNGMLPDDLKKGDIEAKAVYTWVVEEAATEEVTAEEAAAE